ncbi:MAG: N4-gp56 family major capsid protein [Ruminococcaceae bacterium]|nr:N4-gp56 family major capsid protein [Oscillospiraceae bacterium]
MTSKINFSLKLFGAGDVVNTLESVSSGSDLTAEMKVFYDKALIELATPSLVHDQFGQKRSIPKNGGRSVEFRCFSRLPKATKAITEGVTPSGSKLNVTSIVCTPEQYGDYVELSDVFELASVDNTIVEATKKLADQAGRTLDTIVRNELSGGTNVMYCPAIDAAGAETEVTNREALKINSNMTVKQIFKAAAELKAMNAPKIDGYYVGIIHPYVAYDLMQDAGDSWQNVSDYAKPEDRFIGEIGRVAGVRFVESTEAKIFATGNIDGFTELTVKQGSTTKPELKVSEALTNQVLESPVMITVDGFTTYVTEVNNNTLMLTDVIPNVLGVGESIYCKGGTSEGHSVFSTIILGADAYGVTEMEGGIENIIKQKGYGNDPLNQRSSVGWKAFKCAKRLVEEYMIRIESVSVFAPDAEGN